MAAEHPRCDFCNLHMYSGDELFEHMREQHFTCDICQRAGSFLHFTSSDTLIGHLRWAPTFIMSAARAMEASRHNRPVYHLCQPMEVVHTCFGRILVPLEFEVGFLPVSRGTVATAQWIM